MLNKQLQ